MSDENQQSETGADPAEEPSGPSAEPSGTAETGQVPLSPAAYKRLTSGFGPFFIAMAVCVGLAATLVLAIPRNNVNSVPIVNYTFDLASVRRVAPYAVHAPQGLPAEWRPTSSRVTTKNAVSWHLGFATPDDEHAALEESNEQPDGAGKFISRMTSRGKAAGTQQVAGAAWERFEKKERKQRSLVRRLKGVTIVVTGTASYDELAVLAGSLRPEPKPSPSPSPSRS